MHRIDTAEELKKIRARGAGVSSTTLLRTGTLRIVMMALRAGAKLDEHHADGRLSLQVLEGSVDFSSDNETQHLQSGMIALLEAKVPHKLVAHEDAALLLTIAWPSSESEAEQAEAAAHRKTGYA